MAEVELAAVRDERRTMYVFGGYDRRKAGFNWKKKSAAVTMNGCRNMASEEYPSAAVRQPRKRVVNTDTTNGGGPNAPELRYIGGHLADAVVTDDLPAFLLDSGAMWCGRNEWLRGYGNSGGKRIIRFGKGLFAYGCMQISSPYPWGVYVPDAEKQDAQTTQVYLSADFGVSFVDSSGDAINNVTASATEPDDPDEGDYWYNTKNKGLYKYTGSKWEAVPVYHTKLTLRTNDDSDTEADSTTEIVDVDRTELSKFHEGDVIKYTYETESEESCRVAGVSVPLEGAAYILLDAMIEPAADVTITLRRVMPILDYAVAHDNRIWGCRYGPNEDGDFVNEIYACRLGDPLNWNNYGGLIEDAFATSCGEPGPWTGCAVVGDNVVFFKEDCMYKVYGDIPSNYTVQMTPCAGIAQGSDRSAAMINGVLYYHSTKGIAAMAADSLPGVISDALSYKNVWANAIGGTDGRKYYAQMEDKYGTAMYVYDTATGLWHVEDAQDGLICMATYENELLAVCEKQETVNGYSIYACDLIFISPPGEMWWRRNISPAYLGEYVTGSGIIMPWDDDYPDDEYIGYAMRYSNLVEWSFETGLFGLEEPDLKRVKSVGVRANLGPGARFDTYVMYDDNGTWEKLKQSFDFSGTGTRRVEYRLRRCDTYRFRFAGEGPAVIYSITHTYEGDGDRAYDKQQQ